MAKEVKLIGSLVKAVDILKCFQGQEELGVSEIATALGLHKSTAFSLIATLQHLGLMEKSSDNGKYRLGLELFRLGSLVSLNVRKVARLDLEQLQRELDETVHLAQRNDLAVLFLERFESAHALKVYTIDAKPLPVYAMAVGKAILSTLSDRELEDVIRRIRFEKFTETTISDTVTLLREIEAIRNQGYAIDNEEYDLGLYCVAAPLIDWSGKAEFALSVSGPKVRMTGERAEVIKNRVVQTAKEISTKLGYKE